MPFAVQNYPKWAQVTVRTARILAYAFASLTGVAAVLFTPASINPSTVIIIATLAFFGLVCLVGTILQQYVWEWISLFFLSAGIAIYVAGLWVKALGDFKYVSGASIFTMLLLLLVVRIVDLTVYWLKNVRMAALSKGLENDDR
jgi:hypothetical protein